MTHCFTPEARNPKLSTLNPSLVAWASLDGQASGTSLLIGEPLLSATAGAQPSSRTGSFDVQGSLEFCRGYLEDLGRVPEAGSKGLRVDFRAQVQRC